MSSIGLVLLASTLLLVVCGVPLWRGWVPPNRFYGFRTPRTVNDPEVWYPVNRISGLDLVLGGALGSIAVLLADLLTANPLQAAPWLVAAALVPVFVSVVHSFWAASAWLADHDEGETKVADERGTKERARKAARRESEG